MTATARRLPPRQLQVELGARTYPIRIGSGLIADAGAWRELHDRPVRLLSDEEDAATARGSGGPLAARPASLQEPEGRANAHGRREASFPDTRGAQYNGPAGRQSATGPGITRRRYRGLP